MNLNDNVHFHRATRMHSADYAVARCLSVCLSVRPSVRPSHAGIVCKRLRISSKFFHHRVAHHFGFSIPNGMQIFRWGPSTWAPNARGYKKNHDLRPIAGFRGVARNLLRGKTRGLGDGSPPAGSRGKAPGGGQGKAPRSWRYTKGGSRNLRKGGQLPPPPSPPLHFSSSPFPFPPIPCPFPLPTLSP